MDLYSYAVVKKSFNMFEHSKIISHIFDDMSLCIYIYKYKYIYVCIYIYIYLCINIYIFSYIYVFTDEYTIVSIYV